MTQFPSVTLSLILASCFDSSQRPIAASNYVIHTLHCQRNLMKCDKCGEAVPRSGLEEHDLEFHSKVNCPDCHMSVERPHLDTHKVCFQPNFCALSILSYFFGYLQCHLYD